MKDSSDRYPSHTDDRSSPGTSTSSMRQAQRQSVGLGSPSISTDLTPLLENSNSAHQCSVTVQRPERRHSTWSRRLKPLIGKRNVDDTERLLYHGQVAMDTDYYPGNKVNNRKYSLLSFFVLSLKQQFHRSWCDWNVFNVYYLFLSASQFVPIFQVGFWFTYLAPLAFVVFLSMAKEGYDDFKRYLQDRTINSAKYKRLKHDGDVEHIESQDVEVGMLIEIEANHRIPADLVLLRTSEASGTCFIRTDQLDGETDWKLRLPAALVASRSVAEIQQLEMLIRAEAPSTRIDKFTGSMCINGAEEKGLTVENMLWCGCTITAGTAVGMVVYTGADTRVAMNQQQPEPKSGLVDSELNRVSVMCFGLLLVMSFGLVMQQFVQYQFDAVTFAIYLVRFQILLSTIVPISMRVNIDIARFWYTFEIMRDPHLRHRDDDDTSEATTKSSPAASPTAVSDGAAKNEAMRGVMVRNTNIPEELGRIRFLFSDKTGTLTRNKMEFRELHVAEDLCLEHDAKEDFSTALAIYFGNVLEGNATSPTAMAPKASRQVIGMGPRQAHPIGHAVLMLALCNNVTPDRDMESNTVRYQAASPDEIAMVEFASKIGVHLHMRTIEGSSASRIGEITLRILDGETEIRYDVLRMFPFSSERKSMGIILRERWGAKRIMFYMKGADSRMLSVLGNGSGGEDVDWLKEKSRQMASNGRRTLVFGYKEMRQEDYDAFDRRLEAAMATMQQREAAVESVMKAVETGFRVGCATGVDDQLQENVISTLERLRHSGIRIWMLTGDKVETALCIARSTKLFAAECAVEQVVCDTANDAAIILGRLHGEFQFGYEAEVEAPRFLDDSPGMPTMGLVIDGNTLKMVLEDSRMREMFVEVATRMSSVVVARCSPTQKAEVVKLVMDYGDKMAAAQSNADSRCKCGGLSSCSPRVNTVVRTAAIGDGGNDVSMILAAHVGIGVEGKEGKQASLAADFSITRFCDVDRLLTWHGRNAYQCTCQLAQLVLHRGIIYAVVQAVFSMLFRGSTMTVFNSYMIMLYPTFLTAAPVFGIVLNEDSREDEINNFPEKYKVLFKSRSLNTKSFLCWVWLSFLQGGVMMLVAMESFGGEFFRIVSVAFTSLLATELIVVAACLNYRILLQRGKRYKIVVFFLAILFSIAFYWAMVYALPGTIDQEYVVTAQFWETVAIVTASSVVPSAMVWVAGWWITARLTKPRFMR